jgi:hypothetical protein
VKVTQIQYSNAFKDMRTQIQFNILCLFISDMSEDVQNQDKAVEKIHREENLDDDENDYDVEETLSDSDLSEEEEQHSTPP